MSQRTVIEHVGPWKEKPTPAPLLAQWQEELLQKLAMPSARWEGGGWVTERDEFHPALPGKATNCPRKIGIVSTSVVTSAPLSARNSALVDQLLEKRFSCVIWDEAHRFDAAICR